VSHISIWGACSFV